MKSKGSYNANLIMADIRRDEIMAKKALKLKKFRDNKTGIVKEDKK
jgi:hypothetical protein